ncbi:MAG: carboxylating nicotinate-nucleotide diphosphorylase [Pseudomonadota bacterium]
MPSHGDVQLVVQTALAEDLGLAGDITSNACVPEDRKATAAIVARKPGRLAGLSLVAETFRQVDASLDVAIKLGDGETINPGDTCVEITGAARSILSGERVALNYLCHLSGIATATEQLVNGTVGTKAKIACTRKTTPGLRLFEKHAVLCGGGVNHRFGLFDAVMIKDNHIAACGGDIKTAINIARERVGHLVKVEVEIDTLEQLQACLDADPDVILLDNMTPKDLIAAVQLVDGRAILEASGNVTKDTVPMIAATGVDIISSGWITHSAPALDLGLDLTLSG